MLNVPVRMCVKLTKEAKGEQVLICRFCCHTDKQAKNWCAQMGNEIIFSSASFALPSLLCGSEIFCFCIGRTHSCFHHRHHHHVQCAAKLFLFLVTFCCFQYFIYATTATCKSHCRLAAKSNIITHVTSNVAVNATSFSNDYSSFFEKTPRWHIASACIATFADVIIIFIFIFTFAVFKVVNFIIIFK